MVEEKCLFQARAKAKRQGICPNRADRLANKSVIHQDNISCLPGSARW